MRKVNDFKRERTGRLMLTLFFSLLCLIYVFPVLMVVVNSFKGNTFVKTETFMFPTAESFVGFENFTVRVKCVEK